jgi:hypothetical protein
VPRELLQDPRMVLEGDRHEIDTPIRENAQHKRTAGLEP